MIGIINYGLGNINAFLNAYKKLAFRAISVSTDEEINQCSRLILPGVGSYDWVMKKLTESGLVPHLNDFVLTKKKPILGICVGMQIMGNCSDEGVLKGLGWIDSVVKKIKINGKKNIILPHMGWNKANIIKENKLLQGLNDAEFYFLHSFHLIPKDKSIISAKTLYGEKIVSSIHLNNIYATQFHPEKSHESGETILKNFAAIS